MQRTPKPAHPQHRAALPVDVTAVDGVAIHRVPWTLGDRHLVSVIVKATVELVENGVARLIEPDPIRCGAHDRATRSGEALERATEIAPYLPSAGVLVHGMARAPHGRPVCAMSVRLGIARKSVLLDKTLHVYGDRASADAPPAPFSEMPLEWDRGTERGSAPNLACPGGYAGFGPLAASIEAEQLASVRTFQDADWAAFHVAPVDQRLDFLVGDEWIVLDGMHARIPRMQTRLPGLRARATCRAGAGGAVRPLELRGDLLVIDAEAGTASLLWRGHVELDSRAAGRVAVVKVGLELCGRAVAWPEDIPTEAEQTTDEDLPRARLVLPFVRDDPERVRSLLPRVAPANDPFAGETAPVPVLGAPPRALPFRDVAAVSQLDGSVERSEAAAAPPVDTGTPRLDLPPPGPRARVLACLAAGESLRGLDLSRADLTELDLGGQSLVACDLRGAKLTGCRLTQACLDDARLDGADLTGADLRGASLARTRLPRALLAHANLEGARLVDADLSGAQGRFARLANATGRRVAFARGVWEDACFDDARLESPDFTDARVSRASFVGAALVDADLGGMQASAARFDGADLSRARAKGVDARGASMRRVEAHASIWEKSELDGVCLEGASLREACLAGTSCTGALLAGADLSRADLSRVEADGADLTGADLSRAQLKNARLRKARLDGAVLVKASGARADLTEASLVRADLRDAALRGARMRGADLSHARSDGADFRDADLTGARVFGFRRDASKLRGATIRELHESPDSTVGETEPRGRP